MNKSELFLFNEQIVQDYTRFKGHQGELGRIALSELLERYRSHSFLDGVNNRQPYLNPSDTTLDELRFKSPEFKACEMAIGKGCPESILIADLCRMIMQMNERILEMSELIPSDNLNQIK
jgi:hypothetical protein